MKADEKTHNATEPIKDDQASKSKEKQVDATQAEVQAKSNKKLEEHTPKKIVQAVENGAEHKDELSVRPKEKTENDKRQQRPADQKHQHQQQQQQHQQRPHRFEPKKSQQK